MSSTNRSYVRDKNDYYITPVKDIETFIEEFITWENLNGSVLDPCAGGI